jgi:dUTP pyrophosphatase
MENQDIVNVESAYSKLVNALKKELFDVRRVGHFEKVSYGQFLVSVKDAFGDKWNDEQIAKFYDNIKLPTRATKGSAGYDFFSPIPITLSPWEGVKIPTGIRAFIDDGWWLMGAARSGLGFKYFVRFANLPPVVDSDYPLSDNEGHIWAKMRVEQQTGGLEIKAGDAFMQGIFLPYGITYDDAADGVRNGGFGSTNGK